MRVPSWTFKIIGGLGLILDLVFHWLDDNNPLLVIFDGQENPDPNVQALALAAHLLFLTVFALFVILPFEDLEILSVGAMSGTQPRLKSANPLGKLDAVQADVRTLRQSMEEVKELIRRKLNQ